MFTARIPFFLLLTLALIASACSTEDTVPGDETGPGSPFEGGEETGLETGLETGEGTGKETGEESGIETGAETGLETGAQTGDSPECVENTDCPDDNVPACTMVACLQGTCEVVAQPEGSTCDDGNPCLEATLCTNGVCEGGTPIACADDGNPCTTEACDPALGCQSQPAAEGDACDDGNGCTEGDTCVAGSCGGGAPLACNDDNPCTDDVCDPAAEGFCTFTPNAAPCDDGNACTGDDTCAAGSCAAGAPTCPVCETSDECEADDNDCTPDLGCIDGFCVLDPTSAKVCDSSADGPCEYSWCDPEIGDCATTQYEEGTACSDDDPCTSGETCSSGVCAGGELLDPCVPGCVETGAPGCDGCACEECVCAIDDFCCNIQWDASCVTLCDVDCEAGCSIEGEEGGTTTGGGSGLCCNESDIPGCGADPDCENCVCGLDSFCCSTSWDSLCAGSAETDCGSICGCGAGTTGGGTTAGGGTGACCVDSPVPGCPSDGACEACVCNQDSFCCSTSWDGICAGTATGICATECGCGGGGTTTGGGTSDSCEGFCGGIAPSGCECFTGCGASFFGTECCPDFDTVCVGGACPAGEIVDCNGGCTFESWLADDYCDAALDCEEFNYDEGDCGAPGECPSGEIPDCIDGCTQEDWLADGYCDSALNCEELNFDDGDCEPSVPSNGCETSDTPGCDGCACEECVCDLDSFCCSNSWDSLCVSACENDCGGCPETICGDATCDATEDCTSCSEDCGACPECDAPIDCYDGDPCTDDVCTDDQQCTNDALADCCTDDASCASTGGCASEGYCGVSGCFEINACCGGDEECLSTDACITSICEAAGTCSQSASEDPSCCPTDGVLFNGDIETWVPFAVDNAATDGGWHLTDAYPYSGTWSMRFGDPETGNLNFPATSGTLTSDLIAVPAGADAQLTFQYWTAQMGGLKLDLLLDGNWIPAWSETSSNLGTWNGIDLSLNDTAGKVIALRFTYETQTPSIVEGPHLDDVIVTTACSSDTGAGGGSCAAQDTSGEGSCNTELGFSWNGSTCSNVAGCSCIGADCDAMWPTLAECTAAYAGCPGQAPGPDEL